MAASFVAEAAQEVGMQVEIAPSIARGVERGLELAGSDGMVLATGSLYVVGDARENLRTLIAKR
jgi:folylpolyglutamate synthase/dihydropteroate synthase